MACECELRMGRHKKTTQLCIFSYHLSSRTRHDLCKGNYDLLECNAKYANAIVRCDHVLFKELSASPE